MQTYTSKYGERIVGRSVSVGNSWMRLDIWQGVSSPIWAASRTDRSDAHATYPEGYDPKCAWCWLGKSHTEEAHAASISRKAGSPR